MTRTPYETAFKWWEAKNRYVQLTKELNEIQSKLSNTASVLSDLETNLAKFVGQNVPTRLYIISDFTSEVVMVHWSARDNAKEHVTVQVLTMEKI